MDWIGWMEKWVETNRKEHRREELYCTRLGNWGRNKLMQYTESFGQIGWIFSSNLFTDTLSILNWTVSSALITRHFCSAYVFHRKYDTGRCCPGQRIKSTAVNLEGRYIYICQRCMEDMRKEHDNNNELGTGSVWRSVCHDLTIVRLIVVSEPIGPCLSSVAPVLLIIFLDTI